MVLARNGRSLAVVEFTVADDRIVAIDVLPAARLREPDLTVLED